MSTKLQLRFEDLEVESFETTPRGEADKEGTVVGLALASDASCALVPCGPEDGDTFCGTVCLTIGTVTCNTCGSSCGGTCANTCGGTCGSTCGGTCGFTCGTVTCGFTCGTACATGIAEPCEDPLL